MNWLDAGHMDELSRLDTPVHRLDARSKTFVTAVFICIVMSFPRYEVSALTPFALYPLALLSLGGIPPHPIVRKLLVALPFAAVVGIFNPALDRTPVISIGPVAISGGWLSFASILMRFALTAGAALALVACTGMYRLGAGLAQLGVPRLFVSQLLFLYRYLFVVADEGATMLRAVELRAPSSRGVPARVYAPLLGSLLIRSIDRAGRIHQAMVARGFDGELRSPQHTRMRAADWLFVAGWCAFFATARFWNLAEIAGRLLAGDLQ